MADSTSDIVDAIGKDLKLTHIIALVTTTIVAVIDAGIIAINFLSGRVVSDYALMVLGTDITAFLVVYLWVQGIISGNYISGVMSLGQVSMTGGQTQSPVAGITSQGIVFQGLSANDLVALNNLLAQGKIPSALVPLLANMSPDQIKNLISLLSK
jgi:hypothetical protein